MTRGPLLLRAVGGSLAGLFRALLLLTLLALGMAAFFLYTPVGTRLALRLAQATMPELSVQGVEGRLSGPLRIAELHYQVPGAELELSAVELRWRPRALLRKRVIVDALTARHLRLVLSPAPETPPAPSPAKPPSALPLALELRHVAVTAIRIERPQAEPLELDATALDAASWIGNALRIGALSTVYAPLGPLRLSAAAELAEDGARIEHLDLSGPLTAAVEGRWSYLGDSNLSLRWSALRYPLQGEPLLTSAQGSAQLRGGPKDLGFELEARLGARGALRAQGRWAGAVQARLAWTELDYPLAAAEPLLSSAEGGAELSGTAENYRFSLDAALSTRSWPGRLKAGGSGDTQGLKLDTLDLDALRGTLQASGSLVWAEAPHARLEGRFRNLDPGAILPEWPGSLAGSFAVSAAQRAARSAEELPYDARFTLALAGARLRKLPLTLDAQGEYRDAALRIERLELRSGASQFSASGQFTPPLDAALRLRSPALAQLWPGLEGRAEVDARVQGALATPRGSLRADVERLRYDVYRADRVRLESDFDVAGESQLHLRASGLNLGAQLDQLEVRAQGSAVAHGATATAESAGLRAALRLSGTYDARAPSWAGRLETARIAPPDLPAWSLQAPAALRWSPRESVLDNACWEAQSSSACVQARYDQSQAVPILAAGFVLQRLDLAEHEGLFPVPMRVYSVLSGQGQLQLAAGTVQQLTAHLEAGEGRITAGEAPPLHFLPTRLDLSSDDALLRARLVLPLDQGGVKAEAFVPRSGVDWAARPLGGQLRLDLPELSWMGSLSPEIRSARGSVEAQGELAGTLGKPEWRGAARLADGAFELVTPGIRLERVEAQLSGAEGAPLRFSASAHSGEGALRAEGLYSSAEGLDLRLRGENFLAAKVPEARVLVAPDLHFVSKAEGMRLDGRVDIPEADLHLARFDSGVSPSRDQVIMEGPQASAPQRALPLRSEVQIVLGKAVRLEGFGLKTRLEGMVTALDEPGRETAGRGEIRLLEGQYKAYGQDLRIDTGRLLFNGGPIAQPALELKAKRTPADNIEVGVSVRGTLDRPRFSLYSKPAMQQQEQLSWLLLGRPLQSNSQEDRAMLGGAALGLGLAGSEKLANSLGTRLGLDEVTIGSNPLQGRQSTMFTVGKRLSPRLYVSYGVGVFEPAGKLRLLYDIGRGFKIATESGTATGGDLLYSIDRP